MVDNFLLYVLLVVALGIGFLLGRRERRRKGRGSSEMIPQDYFEGLNHLLNERTDLAIETFIESLQVSDETVDTHLALGSLVRRRGEVDKAIRIHQNLLARPVLSNVYREQAELELARDYLVAGLLGRSEKLLIELADKSASLRVVAQEHLLEIYQRERDWTRATVVGKKLSRQDRSKLVMMSHFACEAALTKLQDGELRPARRLLADALDYDHQCARASLLMAKLEFEAGHYRDVLKWLRRAKTQALWLIPETFELFRRASFELGQDKEYAKYLRECLEQAPLVEVISELGLEIQRQQGEEAATQFLSEQLMENPSIEGLSSLLNHAHGLDAAQTSLIKRYLQSLLEARTSYRCGACGFSGHTLMWQCPSCHAWGTVRHRIGDEFD